MKKAILGLVVLGGLFSLAASAPAQDWSHGGYHNNLEHRGYHRELQHRDAHRYPLTWGQHDRLHDSLGHQSYHDQLEHRSYHRNSYQAPYYGGYAPSFGTAPWSGGYGSGHISRPRSSFSFGW